MKLLIQNNRICGTATNEYTGPMEYCDCPAWVDVEHLDAYRVEGGQVVEPTLADAKAAPQHKNITKFVVLARDKGATVRLVGAAPIVYKNMQLSGPERLVIDLDGKWQVKAPGVPKNPAVTNVRIGKGDDKTRIVIDLTGKIQPKFTLSKDGHTLDIRLDH